MGYITVKEFSEATGTSIQNIYKRIKTPKFAPYVKEEDGILLISEEALNLYSTTQPNKREMGLASRIEELERLNQSLEEKVAALNQEKLELLEKQAANMERLFELVENQTKLQENFQVLLAQNQQLNSQLMLTQSTAINQEEEFSESDVTANKPSLFARLFKRKH